MLEGVLRQYIHQIEISSGDKDDVNTATRLGLASSLSITSAWLHNSKGDSNSRRGGNPPSAAPQPHSFRKFNNFETFQATISASPFNLIRPRKLLLQSRANGFLFIRSLKNCLRL